jgi:protein SCO1/2
VNGTPSRNFRRFSAQLIALILCVFTVDAAWAQAENWRPRPENSALDEASIEQKLGARVPADLRFRLSTGEGVRLSKFFAGHRPIILALGYVECPNLCTLVHQGMVHSLEEIELEMGRDFEVLSVSIDPNEPIELTRSARQRYLQIYGRKDAGRGWHSLVGEKPQIQKLADAVGFRYAYDPEIKQYSHPGALIILTPDGTVSRYFFGVTYDPSDLRLALVEASDGAIGSPVDKVLLRCFSYDPSTGEYTLEIMRLVRWAGGLSIALLALWLIAAFYRQKRSVGEAS